jgi:regulator of CtrA degradation
MVAVARFAESALFARLFDEALALAEEASDYLMGAGQAEKRRLTEPVRLAFAGETMRLTARLTQATSWLLTQRALREGELHLADLPVHARRLGGQRLCRGAPLALAGRLPLRLLDLLAQSAALYEQICRCDRLLFGAPPPRIEDGPVPAGGSGAMLDTMPGESSANASRQERGRGEIISLSARRRARGEKVD